MGKRRCRFRFRLDLLGRIEFGFRFWDGGGKQGTRSIEPKEGWDRWGSNAREKERRENLQPRGQHKKRPKGKQPHQPPISPSSQTKKTKNTKTKQQLTSNIQHTLRNQRCKFTNLLIDIIPPASFDGIMTLPPPSSFLICQ